MLRRATVTTPSCLCAMQPQENRQLPATPTCVARIRIVLACNDCRDEICQTIPAMNASYCYWAERVVVVMTYACGHERGAVSFFVHPQAVVELFCKRVDPSSSSLANGMPHAGCHHHTTTRARAHTHTPHTPYTEESKTLSRKVSQTSATHSQLQHLIKRALVP